MKKILFVVACLILVNPSVRCQSPDLARTPEAKKLVDEYIKAGGKNVQDVKNLLEEPFSEPFTPMEILVGKNDSLAGPLLIYVLKNYGDSGVKKDCIEALVKLKDRRAEPALRELLDYKEWGVRLSAANALMGFNKNDPQALQAVKTIFFECPDEHIRAGALGGISMWDPHGMQYLIRAAIEDKSGYVRIRAAALIGGTWDKDGQFAVNKDSVTREIALILLTNWLKNISPQENHQDVSYVIVNLLQSFAEYSYDDRLVIKDLEQMPDKFKSGGYKVLMDKLKTKR